MLQRLRRPAASSSNSPCFKPHRDFFGKGIFGFGKIRKWAGCDRAPPAQRRCGMVPGFRIYAGMPRGARTPARRRVCRRRGPIAQTSARPA
jgi:hypothetical protein